jgi:hypothetical protein
VYVRSRLVLLCTCLPTCTASLDLEMPVSIQKGRRRKKKKRWLWLICPVSSSVAFGTKYGLHCSFTTTSLVTYGVHSITNTSRHNSIVFGLVRLVLIHYHNYAFLMNYATLFFIFFLSLSYCLHRSTLVDMMHSHSISSSVSGSRDFFNCL